MGQEHSKKVLSVATYNHYKRLSSNLPPEEEGGNGGVVEPMNIPPSVLDPSGRTCYVHAVVSLKRGRAARRRAYTLPFNFFFASRICRGLVCSQGLVTS